VNIAKNLLKVLKDTIAFVNKKLLGVNNTIFASNVLGKRKKNKKKYR